MKHTSYSGVEVIRDLLKKDTGNKLIAPVVFSCNYDEVMVPVLFEKKLGKLDYISTQTPQVLIDFQILKMTEGILFSWDVVDEAFCEGTIDTMFDCYMKALEDLIEQPDSWNKKIEFMELSSFPERYENIATLGKTNGYIHDKVFENMEKKSNNIAVLETDTHKSITYQELKIKVENLMCILIEFGVHKGDKVGIYLPKGSNQIVAVLAILLLMFSTKIYGPILAILSQLTSLFHLGTVTNRMRTLLTTPAMEGEDKDVSKYDIELKSVTFGYNRDDVIKDVSFSIPAGSITALVGPSGSGKSTISKLIARFWDIRKGQITIGGMDVKTIEPEHLMRCMSFVFQDVTLFNDTVFNNICVGNMNATEEQVMAAAKAAYCDEFIQRLPDGYQTVLGENGSTLSGGERQRISIARALLKDAPIILLDEATASLDPENEILIQRAIAKLVEGKTVIMIAHRLRTVVDADQIIVLEDGKLAELGTHKELMEKKGLYEKLYHIQQESLGWAI